MALSNLNRQLEALDSTVGLPKAEAVARRVRDINPYAVLHPMEALYNADNREQFFLQAAGMTILWTPSIW